MKGKILCIGFFLGALIGGILWLFFFLMNRGLDILWNVLPSELGFNLYPLALCTAGGVLVGLSQLKFGDIPKGFEEVMHDYKRNKTYPYDKLHILFFAALIPLVFGASVGPEAGLTGVIVGLCCWAGDRFKFAAREARDLQTIGISATLGVMFVSPLFGLITPIEPSSDDDEDIVFPKRAKIVLYLVSVLGGILAYKGLVSLFGGSMGMPRFDGIEIQRSEWIVLFPLLLYGLAMGFVYLGFGRLARFLAHPLSKHKLLRAVIGGIVLGSLGCLLPMVMFSGEHQMGELQVSWFTYAPLLLFLTGFLKLFAIQFCFATGWKGGPFFPLIFCGVSLGYAAAGQFGIDPTFACALVCGTLLAVVMRQTLAVIVLLLMCFPLTAAVPLTVAAVVGSAAPNLLSAKK